MKRSSPDLSPQNSAKLSKMECSDSDGEDDDPATEFVKRMADFQFDMGKAASSRGRIRIFEGRARESVVIPILWNLRIQGTPGLGYEAYKKLTKRALCDFYSKQLFFDARGYRTFREQFEKEQKPFDRLMEWQYWNKLTDECIALSGISDVEPMLREAMTFPHSQLQECVWYYEEFAGTPMTAELRIDVKKKKAMYKYIKDQGNMDDWFKGVSKTDDLRYIVQNVEAKLAHFEKFTPENLNRKLWQMYISFLLTKDKKLAVEVADRYSRLFIGDTLYSFLVEDEDEVAAGRETMKKMKFNKIPSEFKNLPSCRTNIYSTPYLRQNFPFQKSTIHYIRNAASCNTSMKLYQSAKEFYFLRRKVLCHSLFIGDNYEPIKYFRHSLATNGESDEFQMLDPLILFNTLVVNHSSKPTFLTEILPKIDYCNIRFLRITGQKFTIKEYYFLTDAQRIMKLVFQGVSITDDDDKPIVVEDFLYRLPKAMYIDAPIKTCTTPETKEKLFAWVKPQKIHCLSLLFDTVLMKILDPMTLFEFLKGIVVDIKKSTNVVQFEKGNPKIKEYLKELMDANGLYRAQNKCEPPRVLTLKDYAPLL